MGSLPAYKQIAQEQEKLERLYHEEQYTLEEIGDEYGFAGNTISKAFEEAGIEKRSRGGGPREPSVPEKIAAERGEELRELYNRKLMTGWEIADEFGCYGKAIYRAFEIEGIERKPVAERIAENFDLERLYLEEHLSSYKIGDKLGVSNSTIRTALEIAGISPRPVGYQIENPTVQPPFDAGEAAYLAGLIDGEGHVNVKSGDYIQGEKKPKLWVKMGGEKAIHRIADEFGGNLTQEEANRETVMHKWNIARVLDIRLVLTVVSPFLRHKATDADNVLDHIHTEYDQYLHEKSLDSEDLLTGCEQADIDLQYLAGILDGEGHIAVHPAGDGYKSPRIRVKMGAKDTVKWLQTRFGGNFNHRPPEKERYIDQWEWQTQSRSHVEQVLREVEPYMSVRDSNAREVLEFIESEK